MIPAELLPVLCALALCWALLMGYERRVSFLHLILIYWTFQAIAVANYARLEDYSTGVQAFMLGLYAWIAGLYAWRALAGRDPAPPPQTVISHTPQTDERMLFLFVLSVYLVVAYNYAAGGVPLFADQIKQQAFDVGRSGLFGIPGRIARFGPLLLIFLMTAYVQRVANTRAPLRHVLYLAYSLGTASFLMSGHKSGLLVIVQTMMVTSPYFATLRSPFRLNWTRLAVFGGLAFLGVIVIAGVLLESKGSQESVASALLYRIFLDSGKPFNFVVHSYVPEYGIGHGFYLMNDIRYVLSQIGLANADSTGNQMVSAVLHGRPPDAPFNVPVTLTLIGQFYLNFGLAGVAVGCFLTGLFAAWLHAQAFRPHPVLLTAGIYMVQLELFSSCVKGNFIFSFSSMLFGLGFSLALLYGIAYLMRAPYAARAFPSVFGFIPGTRAWA